MAESHWRCHNFALCIDLLMPPFEDLWDLPQDLVDCVLCCLMTVLMETHLIPNPHLNLFLSRVTVTHTDTHTQMQHVNISQNCSHTASLLALLQSPWCSIVKENHQVQRIHRLQVHLLCFTKLMECCQWGNHCWWLMQVLRLKIGCVCSVH